MDAPFLGTCTAGMVIVCVCVKPIIYAAKINNMRNLNGWLWLRL